MRILEIIKHPSELLRQRCKDIPSREYAISLGCDMIATMKAYNGCGLAAPQVGRMINLFVMYMHGKPEICVEPQIVDTIGSSKVVATEECLSIPGVSVKVERDSMIRVEYYNHEGRLVNKRLKGIEARCYQHEYEHLQGVLIIDKRAK